jgi:hypothetical protein
MKYRMFQPHFIEPILAGKKDTTIRPDPAQKPGRKRPLDAGALHVGETFSLRYWFGVPYGSKQVEFAQATVTAIQPVTITERTLTLDGETYAVRGPHDPATLLWLATFSRNDGFTSWDALTAWFQAHHGLPFTGHRITFDLLD